jgi:hypothetical protein
MLPSRSSSFWAYIAFRFLFLLLPLPKVIALSWGMVRRDETGREDETIRPHIDFATLRKGPICPEEYFLLSIVSAVHIEIFTGYHTLLADLQLTGQLLALFIGVGTVGKSPWHSFKQRDSLFKWLMYPVWSISVYAVMFVVNLAMRGYAWIMDLY